ncbi:outer membrane beta-barrel protein [Chitinophaga sp. Cy-1792]|uniref:outer membrane beta-barrel protein n=1 Tax=Chitinophaga sp. Cy-1792 TaxID=2608339 RepID=UPI001423C88C|nr:outer membrane beta-barrel protein [Chitinophaga sp. Cy-1792]NIG57501.1 outer membrane beta-barrel protein [Chitinophaga sp. Cy-1792]
MSIIPILFSFLFFQQDHVTDTVHINGRIIESANESPVQGANIQATVKDGIIATVSTDKKGVFSFNTTARGTLQLTITHIGFKPTSITVPVNGNSRTINIGDIALKNDEIKLQEVKIIGTPPAVSINKDTISFNTGSIPLEKNAYLIDLFRKIPGLTIDADGKMKYYGEDIEGINLNGMLFYGKNAGIAANNLSADLISKIQIISTDDRFISENGNKPKTKVLNLITKNKEKKTLSGTTSLSMGSGNTYNIKGAGFSINPNAIYSIIANYSNMNGYPDNRPANNTPVTSGQFILQSSFRNKSGSKFSVDFQRTNTTAKISTISAQQSFLNNTDTLITNQNSYSTNTNTNNFINSIAEIRLDSTKSLKNKLQFSNNNGSSTANFTVDNFTSNKYSFSNSHSYNTTYSNKFRDELQFSKNLIKLKSTLTANFSFDVLVGNNNSSNESILTYSSGDSTNQSNTNRQYVGNFKNTTYYPLLELRTQINKDITLLISPRLQYEQSNNSRSGYDFDSLTSKYQENDSLKNGYQYRNTNYGAFLNLNIEKEKVSIYLSSFFFGRNQLITDEVMGTETSTRYRTAQPSLTAKYSFTPYRFINIEYQTDLLLPNPDQLITIIDYSNPSVLTIGNPNLQAMQKAIINMRYSTYKQNGSYIDVAIGIVPNNKKIIYSQYFDELGRRIQQPVNINGGNSTNVSIDKKWILPASRLSFNANSSISLVNDISSYQNELQKSFNKSISLSGGLEYSTTKNFILRFNNNIGLTGINYNTANANNIHIFSYGLQANAGVSILPSLRFNTDIQYRFLSSNNSLLSQNQLLATATISKYFFDNRLTCHIDAYDIFRQGNAISASVNNGSVVYSSNQALPNTFMIGLSWRFNKK